MNMIVGRVISAAGLLLALGGSGRAFDVTSCSQTVPHGQTGMLTGDLDCHLDSADSAILLDRGAKLNLNGFTVTGGGHGLPAVQCNGPCKVNGPGTITGGGSGILALGGPGGSPVTAKNVSISNCTSGDGIVGSRIVVKGGSITGCFRDGVAAIRSATIRDANISGNGRRGASGQLVSVRNSQILNNGAGGVAASRVLRATGSVITGNGAQCPGDWLPVQCVDVSGLPDVFGAKVVLHHTTCLTPARYCQ